MMPQDSMFFFGGAALTNSQHFHEKWPVSENKKKMVAFRKDVFCGKFFDHLLTETPRKTKQASENHDEVVSCWRFFCMKKWTKTHVFSHPGVGAAAGIKRLCLTRHQNLFCGNFREKRFQLKKTKVSQENMEPGKQVAVNFPSTLALKLAIQLPKRRR